MEPSLKPVPRRPRARSESTNATHQPRNPRWIDTLLPETAHHRFSASPTSVIETGRLDAARLCPVDRVAAAACGGGGALAETSPLPRLTRSAVARDRAILPALTRRSAVDQRRSPWHRREVRLDQYLRTVRGETRTPSSGREFVGNAFFSPTRMILAHLPDQPPEFASDEARGSRHGRTHPNAPQAGFRPWCGRCRWRLAPGASA